MKQQNMSSKILSSGSINRSLLEVFQSMLEQQEYELKPEAFEQINAARTGLGYSSVQPFSFRRQAGVLIFDWKQNNWRESRVELSTDSSNGALALSFTFIAFASSGLSLALALAFAENQIQPVRATRNGEILELEGRRYRLVLEE